jgi:orotidine-5'-phosphate decarboxylase
MDEPASDEASQPTRVNGSRIAPKERLVVALNQDSVQEAMALVETLGDSAHTYRIGSLLLYTGRYLELARDLDAQGKKIIVGVNSFLTEGDEAAEVMEWIAKSPAKFAIMYGSDEALRAAVQSAGDVGVLAGTVLTSIPANDRMFGISTAQRVRFTAEEAMRAGCAGVVVSGLEAAQIRRLGNDLTIVVAGIRPTESLAARVSEDDQRRIATIQEALTAGADYMIVGRPITDAQDPRGAAIQIQEAITALNE